MVALKILSPHVAENRKARERFLREARAAAKLEDEHILPIHGVHEGSESRGVPWFAMRLAEGGTLDDFLEERGGSLPLEQLTGVARQVALASHDGRRARLRASLRTYSETPQPSQSSWLRARVLHGWGLHVGGYRYLLEGEAPFALRRKKMVQNPTSPADQCVGT